MANEEIVLPFLDVNSCENDADFFRTLFNMHDARQEICVPAMVVEPLGEDGYVKVRPLVRRAVNTPEGYKYVNRFDVKVRLLQFGCGGIVMRNEVFRGNVGLLIAGDRDAKTAMDKNSLDLPSELGEIPDSPDEEAADGGDGSAETQERQEGARKPDSFGMLKFRYGFFIPCSFALPDVENPEKVEGHFLSHFLKTIPDETQEVYNHLVGGISFSQMVAESSGKDDVRAYVGYRDREKPDPKDETVHGFELTKDKCGIFWSGPRGNNSLSFSVPKKAGESDLSDEKKFEITYERVDDEGTSSKWTLKEMDVLSDVEFGLSDGVLKCRKKKQRIIAFVDESEPTEEETTIAEMSELDVVTSSNYGADASSADDGPTFVNVHQPILAIKNGSRHEEKVFETVPHSEVLPEDEDEET